jgi:hypothetical protein
MTSHAMILAILIGVPALLRFIGFAEPLAAIVGALAAFCLAMPLAPRELVGLLDFSRTDPNDAVILVLAVIASLLAGCHAAPRPDRPLGWYAPGDAAVVGTLLVAIVLGARAFEVSFGIVSAGLAIGVVSWLAMAGVGALLPGRGSNAAAQVASTPKRIGIALLALVLICSQSVPAVLLGLLTPLEAFALFSLPVALVFRLVAGLIQGRRLAGYGCDLLRGIADGAWIVLAMFAARIATTALTVSGPGDFTLALSPMWLLPIFAGAIMVLGIIVGPTYGALLAAAIFAPVLKAAGVPAATSALVLGSALMLAFARPSLGFGLLSPAFGGPARQTSGSEAGAMAAGVAIVLVFSAVMAATGGGG